MDKNNNPFAGKTKSKPLGNKSMTKAQVKKAQKPNTPFTPKKK